MRRVVAVGLLVLVPIAVIALVLAPTRVGDPGASQEAVYGRPDGVPPATFDDVTGDWGLSDVDVGGGDPLSGGAALADLDADGDLDLVVANGRAVVLEWTGQNFGAAMDLGVDDAVGVTVAHVDTDAWPDILIARAGSRDRIFWGDRAGSRSASTDLPSGEPSSMLLPADFDLDGAVEVVRLGRGGRSGSADVVWESDGGSRVFTATELPNSARLSLAATVADVDRDGLLDIWVTRDTGYATGSDSLYSRKGDLNGPWLDVADELGTGLEIDGMGVTLADLDGDADLDAYVSDIGENEILEAEATGFVLMRATGAGRIRPPLVSQDIVSSSWASGPADVNLDGQLDLVVVGGGFPTSTVLNKIAGTSVADAEPPAVFLGLGGGRYTDGWLETGLSLDVVGRGLTLGDIDGDGDTDAVIVTRSGRVHALRNSSTAASLTVELAHSCGAGVEVSVTSASRAFTTVLPQFTYGGAHAAEVTVGLPDLPATISAQRGDDLIARQPVRGETHRERVELDC